MNRGRVESCFSFIVSRCLWGAFLLLSFLFVGCGKPTVHAMVDEAFALVYPELSATLVRTFPPLRNSAMGDAKDTGPYLAYPLQAVGMESLLRGVRAPGIFVTTPAVAEAFPTPRIDGHIVGINLLAPAESFFSIEWDSEWAYHEMGLIAGYQIASLRKDKNPGATAAILFSRGLGRSQTELDAFTQAFEEGMRLAESSDAGIAPASEALSVFDVDSMNLPGDRLEQVLSALRQAETKNPLLLVLASGSRLALQAAARMNDIDIMVDLRGLGPDLSTTKFFVAIGENTQAFVAAIKQVSQKIEKKEPVPTSTRVKPTLILSKKARSIQAIVDGRP